MRSLRCSCLHSWLLFSDWEWTLLFYYILLFLTLQACHWTYALLNIFHYIFFFWDVLHVELHLSQLPLSVFWMYQQIGVIRSIIVNFLQHGGSFDRDLLFKGSSERLRTSMPKVWFEPTDPGTERQNPTNSAIVRL